MNASAGLAMGLATTIALQTTLGIVSSRAVRSCNTRLIQ